MEQKKFHHLINLQYFEHNHYLLLAFPHSGANAQSFNSWKPYIPKNVNFAAIQYPGRGSLIKDAPSTNINKLIDIICEPIYEAVNKHLGVIFYGHSLGA